MKVKKTIIETYNTLGDKYYMTRKNKKGTSYFCNELLESKTLFRLLGNIKGKKILDLGCGPGFQIRKMKKKGAKVRGIDLSDKLIEIAKKQNPGIEIIKGDITKKLSYKNSEFDIVSSSLVFGHIEKWEKILQEVHRILKKDGIFIFSAYNPMTELMTKEKWFFKKFKIIKDYFEEKLYKTYWDGCKTWHHHKTYGTIVKLLVRNNFEIIDYEDCKPPKYSSKQYPKKYKDYINMPRFCIWKVRKK